MPMINFTEPFALFIGALVFVLVLWFAYESKKSIITGIMLFIFVSMLVMHALEFTMGHLTAEGLNVTIGSIVYDLIFVFISFISYLWIDDIEAKFKKKKVINNNLDWFWGRV